MAAPELVVTELHRLSQAQYAEVERLLKEWKTDVLAAAKRHPAKGYELGMEQARAFVKLLGGLPMNPVFGGTAPSKLHAVKWLRNYTLHELEGSLDEYIDTIRSACLYGQAGGVNPLQVSSWLYHASGKVKINWRMIARTEMVRANTAGRLDACQEMGYGKVWVPPHVGACAQCKRVIENKVFTLDELRDKTNYKRKAADYIPCIPLHPMCRHVALPYVQSVYENAQEQYKLLPSEEELNEWFESSGQLKPQYANEPRLLAYLDAAEKVRDPYAVSLQKAITEETQVRKAFFTNPQRDLDPLVFHRRQLRADVRDRVTQWWRHTLGADAEKWSHIYLTGQATSLQWAGPGADHDLDLQIVVDYPKLRRTHREYAPLSDPELHAALVTHVKVGLDGFEAAPGLTLDAFIRPEQSPERFGADVRSSHQAVWDVLAHAWLIPPREMPVSEDIVNQHILEGLGGQLALNHPEWVSMAARLSATLSDALNLYRAAGEGVPELQAAYTFLHDLRAREYASGHGQEGVGNFIWQYLASYGPLYEVKHLLEDTPIGKVFPRLHIDWPTTPDGWVAKKTGISAGTEHWITVHPNGPDEKGIPVLIRENGDGTARVIGGGGGHLDYLRISTKGRIKPKPGETQPKPPVEPVTEEMAEAARTSKQQAQDQLRLIKGRIGEHVQAIVKERGLMAGGEAVGWEDLSSAEQAKLIANASSDALYQSTYGQQHDLHRAQAPPGPIVVTPAPHEPGPADAIPETPPIEDADGPPEPDENAQPDDHPNKVPERRIKLPLSTEEADQIWEELSSASVLRRRIREANRVLAGESQPADVAALEWEPIDAPAEAQRKAAMAAQTEVNRSILDMVDAEHVEGRKGRLAYALKKGAFDSFDSLSYSVFGRGIFPPRLQELLGVQGTAQLLTRQLQVNGVDLKAVKDTIDELTDERQSAVTRIDLNRARYATKQAMAMKEARRQAYAGEGIDTITHTNVQVSKKLIEAANTLGMAIAGSEALHTLRSIIDQPVNNIRVEGYGSRGQIMDLARRADVKVHAADIERVGPSNYALNVPAERMQHLLDGFQPPDELKDYLSKIRTGEGLDHEIEEASHPAGYSRTLDRAQAQGSLFLRATKSGILAFAPGVGKTDTAVGAAMQLMHDKPGTKVLIVAPATALQGTWAKTIQKCAPGKTLTVYGRQPGEGVDFDWEKDKSRGASAAGRLASLQAETASDFTIIGFDQLKSMTRQNPHILDNLGHSVVITDEAQYAKNEKTQRYEGIDVAGSTPGVDYRWALTGTPVEKNLGEMYTTLNWARPGAYGSRGGFNKRFEDLNQYAELTSEEKLAQFREALGDGVFFQSQNMSDMPPFPDLEWVDTQLSEGHIAALAKIAQDYNRQWQDRHYDRTVLKLAPQDSRSITYNMGGYSAMMAALMKPEQWGYEGPNARVTKMADMIEANPDIDWDGYKEGADSRYQAGDKAGHYAGKSIVFGRETQPLQPLVKELGRRGIKVFYTQGSGGETGVSNDENDSRLQEFLKYKGKCVLVTSDKNKTARSLQFGSGNDGFQHGANQIIHSDVAQNNADLQQRVARAWRRGAQVPVRNQIMFSGTPFERSMRDQLASELQTQRAVGNPEERVESVTDTGQRVRRETVRQKLRRKGQGAVAAPPVTHGRQARKEETAAKTSDDGRVPAGDPQRGRIHPGEWTRAAARVAARTTRREGGGTFELKGNVPHTGYQVAIPGHTVTLDATATDEQWADAILQFHADHIAPLRQHNVGLGTWLHNGKLYLDPSETIGDKGQAIMQGKQRNQIEIWDNANAVGIPTGGTGE